ncbi:PAS domain-containing protein, partial [Paraconexibacter sp.]|uniref:PAS domain-containing protein n=1 Tax=Paraconexibacter sp. TaxID=2949640 RepID=UPI0035638CDB
MTPPGDRDARDLTAVPLADAVDAMERVALVLFDRDMRITAIHGGAVAARGLDPDQMVGRWAPDVVPAHAWETLGPMYARALDGEITTVDYTTDDGEEVYETIICPVYTDGVLTGGIATARSVTEERRARKELAETARQFRTMAETSLEGHCRHRPDGTILWASPAMESLLGYPPETLVGITGGVIVHPDDRAAREEAYARLRETREPVTFELRCRHADGGHRWFEMTLRGSFDDAGR